ncbi:amidase [Paenibacillus sinopodophylli]|uniref:amidase n=1 Tax=Paenibacillus sinopodophylli TaxID=1837342 RepID=UPI001FE4BBB8|nr:amidase [Paenibacillus sinopodophylli]
MMISTQLHQLTLAEAGHLIRTKSVSPVELTQAYIDRIHATNDRVQAWATLTADAALASAAEAERQISSGQYKGLLHGIPYGAKDIISTAGIRTAAGSLVNSDYIPEANAAVIERLESGGAILLGKTTTTEYAYQGGEAPTRNPWNLAHTPGGSSSGSAAAVAAGMAAFTLGTQTFGSLIRPAAYNGLTCMKPTFGRISRYGVFYASWSLDHIGAFTRTVEDTAIALEGLAGQDSRDPASIQGSSPPFTEALNRDIRGMIIGIPDSFFIAEDPAISAAVEAAIEVLRSLGVRIKKVKLPACIEEAVAAHRMTMRAEGAAFHMEMYKTRAEYYGPAMREQLELGYELSAVDYLHAQRVRTLFRNEMMHLFDEVDVLLTPSTPTLALPGYKTGSPMFNGPLTNTGLPAMTIPIGLEASRQLPIGMQLAGPLMGEDRLLAIGHQFQQATKWHQLTATLEEKAN